MLGSALAPFRLANRQRPLIIKYHRFSEVPGARAVSRQLFAEQLRYLTRRYAIVTIPELVAQLSAGTRLARPMAAITIDDGHRDAYEIAFPILKRFGVPATLFAVTGFLDRTCWLWTDQVRYLFAHTRVAAATVALGSERIDLRPVDASSRLAAAALVSARLKRLGEEAKIRALRELADALHVDIPEQAPPESAAITWEQARELDRNGVAVESHTVTHPILTNVEPEQLHRELSDSKRRLECALGRPVTVFCYPNGGWNRQVRDAVAQAGYTGAVTTTVGFNETCADPLCLKRLDGDRTIPRFAVTTSGFDVWETSVRQTAGRWLPHLSISR